MMPLLMFGIRAGFKIKIGGYGNPEFRECGWVGDSGDEGSNHHQA